MEVVNEKVSVCRGGTVLRGRILKGSPKVVHAQNEEN